MRNPLEPATVPTPPLDPTLPTPQCPRCGEADLRLSRRHSRAQAGRPALGLGLAGLRYRCRAPGCGWRGGLSSQSLPLAAWLAAAAGPARRVALGLALLAAVGGSGGVLLVAGLETWVRHATGLDVAHGQSHDGLPLAPASKPQGGHLLRARTAADDLAADHAALAGLTLRQGCAWGQPGRNPYRGTTEQALTAAGLPPEVVRQIAAQRQAGQKVGRLKISRDAIRLDDGSREFNPRQMAMSFGHTLCLNTRVNFAPGHVEAADLFEARDAQGQMHAVMVPDVCGNVTVLGARRAGGVVAGVAGDLADRSLALAAAADALALAPDDAGAVATDALTGDGAQPADSAVPAPDATARPESAAEAAQEATEPGGATLPAPHGARAIAWADLDAGWLPRTALIAGLNGGAVVLARASTTLGAVPVPGGAAVTGTLSTRQNALDPRTVPAPGTLPCVLAALAGLVWVGRRGR